jgi:hypothetical protein
MLVLAPSGFHARLFPHHRRLLSHLYGYWVDQDFAGDPTLLKTRKENNSAPWPKVQRFSDDEPGRTNGEWFEDGNL